MQVGFTVVFFLLFFSTICHFESNYFNYEAEDQSYETDENFSYENNQPSINEESKGMNKFWMQ